VIVYSYFSRIGTGFDGHKLYGHLYVFFCE